jgi:hypothetical protein
MDKPSAQHHESKDEPVVENDSSTSDLNDGLTVPKVTWYKHKGLLKLYLMIPVLLLSATTNGYDSSLLNGLQTLEPWQECEFCHSLLSRLY